MARKTAASKAQLAEMSEATAVFHEAVALYAMEEGLDGGDIALALEDRGWTRLGEMKDGDISVVSRKLQVIRARMYALLDPNAVLALRTWTNYTLGSGMTVKAADPKVQVQIDTFIKNPKNRTMTSAEGQRKHNRRLLTDGEMFFAIFETDDGFQMRKVDCTEITQFIYDPEDSETVWAYRRERRLPGGSMEIIYYRHWAWPTADLTQVYVKNENGGFAPTDVGSLVEDNVVLYHVPFEALHQRGNSLFTSTLSWMTAMRQFMEDRISITKGLAKYIQKLTIKGGKSQLDKVASSLNALRQSGMPGTGVPTLPAGAVPPPFSPGGVPGRAVRDAAKTFMQNDNVSLDNMPRTTGASDAQTDHKIIRLMLCAGMGLTEPYFGDAESGNLASATAMELPMLKQFQSHQKFWADTWVDIFTIICGWGNPQPIVVDVDYPPIVIDDVTKLAAAIVSLCAEFPELKQPEVLKLALTTLGLNNVDDVMKAVLKMQAENKVKADNVANGLLPNGQPQPAPQPGAGGPQPVVLPPKPARQVGAATGQKVVALQQAADHFAALLEADVLEFEEEQLSAD